MSSWRVGLSRRDGNEQLGALVAMLGALLPQAKRGHSRPAGSISRHLAGTPRPCLLAVGQSVVLHQQFGRDQIARVPSNKLCSSQPVTVCSPQPEAKTSH